MKRRLSPIVVISIVLLMLFLNVVAVACRKGKSAADTIKPVSDYFSALADREVIAPNLTAIENTPGIILTWKVKDARSGEYTDYSWVLALNTDDLKKAMIAFDSARAWNTEKYIFLPVSVPAVEVHKEVGLMVPQAIYDEDGMNRIKELVMSGEKPEGSLVDQFDKFME